MTLLDQTLTLPKGTPFKTFKADTGAFNDSGVLLHTLEFRVTDIGWEYVKVTSKDTGNATLLRQNLLKSQGVLPATQAYADRKPAAGDMVEVLPGRDRGVVKAVKEDEVWYYLPNDPAVHKVNADQTIVVPIQPFGYPQWGYPAFESLVGLSEQGYLRRPKTALMHGVKGADFILKKLSEVIAGGQKVIALDTETTGLTGRAYVDKKDFVIGICISWDANSGFYLPTNDETWQRHKDIVQLLRDEAEVVMHNATFDIIAVKEAFGVDLREGRFHDTQLLSKLVDENRMNHKLKPLSAELLGRSDVIQYDSVSNDDNTLVGVDPVIVTEYAAADAANTFGLYDLLMPQLQADPDLFAYYQNIELPAISRIAVPIADNGLRVDRDKLTELHERIAQDRETQLANLTKYAGDFIESKDTMTRKQVKPLLDQAYDRMESMYGMDADTDELEEAATKLKQVKNLGKAKQLASAKQFKKIRSFINLIDKALSVPEDRYDFNPNSKLQLKELIHDFWKLPVVKITKTGDDKKQEKAFPWTKEHDRQYSSVGTKSIPAFQVAMKALKKVPVGAEEFFDSFKAFSKADKLLSAFTTPTLANLDASNTLYIHPSFNSLGTKSSRSSCQNPNLQQLPSDDSLYDLRDCFIPDDEDHVFIDADLTNVKVRKPAMAERKVGELSGTPNSQAVGNTEPR